jgi:CcmD family protein
MRLLRVLAIVLALAGAWSLPASAQGQPPRQQTPDEFVPIDELPPEEQMPAAPMVVAAYAFVWVAFVAYIFTLVKRVKRVEADLRALEQERR